MAIGFTTLEEANTYASSILTKTWTVATDQYKEQSLQSAYNLMLSYSNQYDYSNPALQILKDTQTELAIYLYENKDSQAITNIQQGLTQKSVGNTSESYATGAAGRYQKIPDYIFQMLSSVAINGFTVDIQKDNRII